MEREEGNDESNRASRSVRSVCPYCGVGCGIVLEVRGGRITKLTGDKQHPANEGKLCLKGANAVEPLYAEDRLKHAQQRSDRAQPFTRSGLEDAIQLAAGKLRGIIERDGPDAVAIYLSGQVSMEAQYLSNKLCKGFFGTNNIDSNSRLCMASAASGYKLSLGADAPPGSYRDIEKTNCFFVIGSNMADCHPILFLRVLAAQRRRGARLIVADPRRTATAQKADLYLPIEPGTDLALLNGLLHLLVEAGEIDRDFIARYTESWDDMPDFLKAYTPAHVAEVTGLREGDIRTAANWIGSATELITFWTMGLGQQTSGTWNTNAICNLHLATGKICRPGSGPFSLTGQPNAMGGREVGYLSLGLPGQRSVLSAEDRAFTERVWQLPEGKIKAEPGPDAVQLFEQIHAGKIKALWVIGTNPVASMPARAKVVEALRTAELVIVQDAYHPTETSPYADILLPGALWAEAEGVMVNSERYVTLMQKAVDPPGDAKADWEILARVARAMGYSSGFSFQTASEIFDEIRLFANARTDYDLRGMSYSQLRSSSMQWPCAPGESAGKPIRYLHADQGLRFATKNGKAVFLARPQLPAAELPDDAFPFVLITGRYANQWHTLTKTGKVAILNKLDPAAVLEINPEDAAALGIAEGDRVEVTSRRGRAVYPAQVTDRIRAGSCFAPMHWNDVFGEALAVNAVTNDAVDPISKQPQLKFCAVRLTKVAPRAVPNAHDGATDGAEPSEPMLRGASGGFSLRQKQSIQQAAFAKLAPISPLGHPLMFDPRQRQWWAEHVAQFDRTAPPKSS